MAWNDKADLARALAKMTPAEIEELRNEQLTAQQIEAERQAALAMDDPVGTVRIYGGLESAALLVRIDASDEYETRPPEWKIFWDYRADEELEDHHLDREKLGEPLFVLSAEQQRMLLGWRRWG